MTVAQIAKIAGVSTATVSRVINESGPVSARAVQAVNSGIEKLNYQPRKSPRRQASAPQQRQKRRQRKLAVLGLVMPGLQTGFFPSLIRSFNKAAAEFAHQVLTCNSEDSVSRQADVILQLTENRVAGVAVLPPDVGPSSAYQIRHLQAAGIPVVILQREIEGAVAPFVELPYEELGYRAAQSLAEAGHRSVALFFARRSKVTDVMDRGFRRAVASCGLLLCEDAAYVGSGGSPEERHAEHEIGVEAALARVMALPETQRPTAIFAPADEDAELLYLLLMDSGLRVPQDFSLLTVGSSRRSTPVSRRLAAITVDEVEIGRVAARLLIDMAAKGPPFNRSEHRMIPLLQYSGKTLGPPPLVARG